jgi:AFG3 family protein
VPWFAIGSVEAFERNMETAQNEIGTDQGNFLTVTYKDEMEA